MRYGISKSVRTKIQTIFNSLQAQMQTVAISWSLRLEEEYQPYMEGDTQYEYNEVLLYFEINDNEDLSPDDFITMGVAIKHLVNKMGKFIDAKSLRHCDTGTGDLYCFKVNLNSRRAGAKS